MLGFVALSAGVAGSVLVASADTTTPTQRLVVQLAAGQQDRALLALDALGVKVVAAVDATAVVIDANPTLAKVISTLDGVVSSTLGGVLQLGDGSWNDLWSNSDSDTPTSLDDVTKAIGAQDLWAQGIDGKGVGVAVIDTGVVPVPGLSTPGKVVNGPDLSFEGMFPEVRYLDGYGHGTHMAGIVAGNDGVRGGFRGVAPGARIVNVKVGATDGSVDVSQVVAAVDWVVEHKDDNGANVRVISLSYGTTTTQDPRTDPLAHAVENAWRAGIVVVAAAGNDGNGTPLRMPARDASIITVGASDLQGTLKASDDTVASFSSGGTRQRGVDVLAPGTHIASLRDPGSTVDLLYPSADGSPLIKGSGSSQATAVVAGAAALLVQAHPGISPDQVKARLMQTASPLRDTRPDAGRGRINVLAARQQLLPLSLTLNLPSQGTGSLEASRGDTHVADDATALTGEVDAHGNPWNAATWAKASTKGTSWVGGTWNGKPWTGSGWTGTSWAGAAWAGAPWTGTSWNGVAWGDHDWTRHSWTGATWEGRSWTRHSWTDSGDWEGRSWTRHSWTSTGWSA